MQTLSYGYKLPETGDRGSIWFPALEDNIERLNDHSHNGTDSALLTTSSMTATTNTASSTAWDAVVGKTGLYSQVVTMPTGFVYDSYMITFRNAATSGELLYLQTEKVGTGTYRLYCNDNSISVKAFYGF